MNRSSARGGSRALFPAARTSLAAVAFLLVLGACAPSTVRTLPVEEGDAVLQLEAGHPRPGKPPAPELRPLSVLQVEHSLERLVVRPHTFILFADKQPERLLTDDQVRRYAAVLTPALNALAPDQRLWLQFFDKKHKLINEVRIYLEGDDLVYSFVRLYREDRPLEAHEVPSNGAAFVLQPGQRVLDRAPIDTLVLRDPLRAATLLKAQARADKRAMIDKALAAEVIDSDEAERLRREVEAKPNIAVNAWSRYFEKRETLERAHNQGLMDAAARAAALEKLEGELGIR